MANNDYKKATENLKKAVPLMMKNHVPVTPANYALWYTYVDKAIPSLNIELDSVIDEHGLCPPEASAILYKNYISKRAEADDLELKANLELLLNEAASSMSNTLNGTSQFTKVIDKNLENLESASDDSKTIEEITEVVKVILSESKEMQDSTRSLDQYLKDATAEITRLKSQLSEMQKDVLFDSLSELYNRRAFDEDLQTLCHAKQSICLILLDIDHFKDFNDIYGHLFGDSVIKSIAKRLLMTSKDGIASYRFGGEEFTLIVPNKPISVAIQLAETLRKSIESLSIKDKKTGNEVNRITASFGVAEFEVGESAEDLIDKADRLLYRAKQSGRNQVRS